MVIIDIQLSVVDSKSFGQQFQRANAWPKATI